MVDPLHPFPHLPSKALNVAVELKRNGQNCFGLVPIPKSLPPYLRLSERGLRYVLTEHVVLSFVAELFDQYQVVSRAVISVTRNADLSPADEDFDVNDDYRQHMRKVLKKRSRLAPVRLEIQGEASEAMTAALCRRLELSKDQVFRSKSPPGPGLCLCPGGPAPGREPGRPVLSPLPAPLSRRAQPGGEHPVPGPAPGRAPLLYPYHSMDPFLKLVKEAANDPAVLIHQITIYRLAAQTKLIEYLADAAENGKDVTVLMELRARFDEQNNIQWAERLEEAGCTLLYGFEGVKVHSKICLITRKERGHIQHITPGGHRQLQRKDGQALHRPLPDDGQPRHRGRRRRLLPEPVHRQPGRGIPPPAGGPPQPQAPAPLPHRRGDRQGRAGQPAYISSSATRSPTGTSSTSSPRPAGRGGDCDERPGICCLRPGVPDRTDRIQVFSIVGRFLEHPRIFLFGAVPTPESTSAPPTS